MSDFTLEGYSLETLSGSQVSKIIKVLKNSENSSETIKILRFLHAFLTSGEETGNQVLEHSIIPTISDIIANSENENVKAEASSVLTILALKAGTWKQSLVADLSILMFSNLLDVNQQVSNQAIDAILQQFQKNPSSTQSLTKATSLVLKLTDILNTPEASDVLKGNILGLLAKIVDVNVPQTDFDENGNEGEGSTSTSFSSSSSSSSASLPFVTFTAAVKRMAVSVGALRSGNAGLMISVNGFVDFLKSKYGEEICFDESVSSVLLPVNFEPDLAGLIFVSKNACGPKCGNTWHSVFLDYVMRRGIYKIDLEIVKMSSADHAMLGFCPVSQKELQIPTHLGNTNIKSGGLYFHTDDTLVLYVNTADRSPNYFSSHPYKKGTIISMEVNLTTHTATFFVNTVVVPHYVVNIPDEPLAFVVSAYQSGELRMKSLRKLGTSSIPANATLTAVALL